VLDAGAEGQNARLAHNDRRYRAYTTQFYHKQYDFSLNYSDIIRNSLPTPFKSDNIEKRGIKFRRSKRVRGVKIS